MPTTLITSCLSLLSITIGSLIVSKKIKQINEKSDQLLASVWLFIGITFFFMTIRTSFFILNFLKIGYFFALIVQLILISYYKHKLLNTEMTTKSKFWFGSGTKMWQGIIHMGQIIHILYIIPICIYLTS